MYIDLFVLFVKRGMRDMNKIKERINKIRKRVEEKNNERSTRSIKRYYFDVLHDNAVPKIMLIKIIKNTNTKKVQNKSEIWKYKVRREQQQEQLHKTRNCTVLRELKSVATNKNTNKQYNNNNYNYNYNNNYRILVPKNHVTFIGSDYIKDEIVSYKEHYGVNKLPNFVSHCEVCYTVTDVNVYTIVLCKLVVMCKLCSRYFFG